MCRLLPRLTRPSPFSGWVGIRIVLFEACSGFTRVTARTLARPPKAAFVTGLRRGRLPGHAARQLPAQSTTRWVEPSSTGDSRLRGARRVEERRGSGRRGGSCCRRLSPSAGASVHAVAPFPLPAHRTGRADLRHPALRLASPQGTRRDTHGRRSRHSTPCSQCSTSNGNRLLPRPATLCRLTRKARTRSRT